MTECKQNRADPAITATVADGDTTIAFTIVDGGGLTLDGVKMTISFNLPA